MSRLPWYMCDATIRRLEFQHRMLGPDPQDLPGAAWVDVDSEGTITRYRHITADNLTEWAEDAAKVLEQAA